MIKMYVITALRSFRRQPVYTLINFMGLALAISSVILIYSWIKHQYNYDNFHEKYNEIYQVNAEVHWGNDPWVQTNIQAAVAPEMKRRYPEVKEITRVNYTGDVIFSYKSKIFYEDRIMLVDSAFFKIFTFPIISGSEENFFKNPQSIFFSETMAEKYFPDENPIGKIIKVDKYNLTVAGIVKDPPANSSINYNFILPIEFQKTLYNNPDMDNNWGSWYLYTYLTLNKGVNPDSFNIKLATLYNDFPVVKKGNIVLIHPLKKMRLHPPQGGNFNLGLLYSVYIIAFIALMILAVACINFMNLSTASFSGRAKDVGIRKTIGAKRKLLFGQFLSESLLIAIASGIFSVLIVKLVLPYFNLMVEEEINITVLSSEFIFVIITIIIFSGLLSGSYPSIFLSSFKPARVLKGRPIGKSGKNITRRVLVVFQFSVAIFLITSTLFSVKQLRFLLNKNLGYNTDQVVYVKLNDDNNYQIIKEELLKNPNVEKISACSWWGFDNMNNSYYYDYEGKPEGMDQLITFQDVDFDYIETLDIPIVEGRSFSSDNKSDLLNSYIINETAVETFGMTDPVGMRFMLNGNRGKIIGVMKDVHFRTLFSEIDPRAIRLTRNNFGCIFMKIAGDNAKNNKTIFKKIKSIEKDWLSVVPEIPFDYQFINDMYNNSYNISRTVNRLLIVFASLAIFISCIGLFGMAIFSTEQRTKEIGVRKVNGAKIVQVIEMLLSEFLLFVIIAFVIIVPLAYYFIKVLMSMYSYTTEVSWWLYALSGLIVTTIAFLTVGIQSMQAAQRNPVEALRYE